jgi:hypothetical protein
MANTTNFNWETPDDTDLVKDGAAAIRTLGNSIDTSFVDLKGGTTGQILSKASNTDLDYTWIANDQGDITEVQAGTGISVASGTGPIPVVTNTVATAYDAKGDLVVGTGADTFSRLAVGTNGYTLVADSAETTGLKWQAAPSTGALTLISRSSFSNVATASMDNVFTSTYKTYLVVVENCYTNTASQNTLLRVKYSTTTLSTNYFAAHQIWNFANTNSNQNGDDATSITLFQATTSTYMGAANLFFAGVGNTSERFRLWGNTMNQNSLRGGVIAATTDTAQNYGSVLLLAASGNITATIAIYGLGI